MSSVVPSPMGNTSRRKRRRGTGGGRSGGRRDSNSANAETRTLVTPTRKKGACRLRVESRNLNMYVTPIDAQNQHATARPTCARTTAAPPAGTRNSSGPVASLTSASPASESEINELLDAASWISSVRESGRSEIGV
eukprot:scaffold14284_cov101-Isochrysis_galbana.AAC.1